MRLVSLLILVFYCIGIRAQSFDSVMKSNARQILQKVDSFKKSEEQGTLNIKLNSAYNNVELVAKLLHKVREGAVDIHTIESLKAQFKDRGFDQGDIQLLDLYSYCTSDPDTLLKKYKNYKHLLAYNTNTISGNLWRKIATYLFYNSNHYESYQIAQSNYELLQNNQFYYLRPYEKFRFMNDIAYQYNGVNPVKANVVYEEILNESDQLSVIENQYFIETLHTNIAYNYLNIGKYDKARYLYHKVLSFETFNDFEGIFYCYIDLANLETKEFNFQRAIVNLKKAEEIILKCIDSIDIALTYTYPLYIQELYTVYTRFQEPEENIPLIKKQFKFCKSLGTERADVQVPFVKAGLYLMELYLDIHSIDSFILIKEEIRPYINNNIYKLKYHKLLFEYAYLTQNKEELEQHYKHFKFEHSYIHNAKYVATIENDYISAIEYLDTLLQTRISIHDDDIKKYKALLLKLQFFPHLKHLNERERLVFLEKCKNQLSEIISISYTDRINLDGILNLNRYEDQIEIQLFGQLIQLSTKDEVWTRFYLDLINELKDNKLHHIAERNSKLLTLSKSKQIKFDRIKNQLISLNYDLPFAKGNDFNLCQAKIDSLELELRSMFSESRKAEEIPNKLDYVQKQLAPNAVYLNYYLHDNHVFILAIEHKAFSFKEVPFKSKNKINEYTELLSQPNVEEDKLIRQSKELYETLINPMQKSIQDKNHLYLSVDDQLAKVSFQAFQSKKGLYLIDQYKITNLQNEFYPNQVLNKKYEEEIIYFVPGFMDYFEYKTIPSTMNVDSFHSTLLPQFISIQKGQQIKNEFPSDIVLFADSLATKQNFYKYANSSKIIHLSSHGLSDPKNPLQSKIFLYGSDKISSIQLSELIAKGIHSELIVLLACSTGKGEIVDGLGGLSMSKGFQLAGIPRSVVSFYDIDEAASNRLIFEFYIELFKNNDAVEALRNAQLKIKNDQFYSLPYYWAGLTLITNQFDNAIALNQSPNHYLWLFGFLVLIAIAYLVWRLFFRNNK